MLNDFEECSCDIGKHEEILLTSNNIWPWHIPAPSVHFSKCGNVNESWIQDSS